MSPLALHGNMDSYEYNLFANMDVKLNALNDTYVTLKKYVLHQEKQLRI